MLSFRNTHLPRSVVLASWSKRRRVQRRRKEIWGEENTPEKWWTFVFSLHGAPWKVSRHVKQIILYLKEILFFTLVLIVMTWNSVWIQLRMNHRFITDFLFLLRRFKLGFPFLENKPDNITNNEIVTSFTGLQSIYIYTEIQDLPH